jgi:hypothetical protein
VRADVATLIQYLKLLVLALMRFGIALAALFYLAHFTKVQSVVLAIIGLCAFDGYRLAYKVASKQQPQFEPFWVRIQPNWFSICQDFGLSDVEKWDELLKKCQPDASVYSVLRNGMSFTMLSQTLFYSDDHHTFFGQLDFHLPLTELKRGPDEYFAPQFCIKRTLTREKENRPVIEFGLITHNPLKNSLHQAGPNGQITIARLPEIAFYAYFHPDDYDFGRIERIEEETKAQLAESGWTQEPHDSSLDRSFEINHKYLRVIYRGLS